MRVVAARGVGVVGDFVKSGKVLPFDQVGGYLKVRLVRFKKGLGLKRFRSYIEVTEKFLKLFD